MKPRDYCCCAIPLVNAGIYAVLTEQFIIGILVGVLSVATPSIVGASTPGFAPWVLGIICFVVSGVQVLGFIGVSREKPTLYRRYVVLHGLVILAAFAVAATWTIMSGVKHSDAKTKCISDFFGGDGDSSEGDTLCNIFAWVDIGIMGALWVILAIFHIYLFVVISSYGASQRRDHNDWDRQYDPTQPLTKDSIPLTDRSDPWDSRASEDLGQPTNRYSQNYKHVRQNSSLSATDVLAQEPYQQTNGGYKESYNYDYSTPYQPYTDHLSQPTYAFTQPANPTPYDGSYTSQQDGRLDFPSRARAHPGES